MPLWPHRQIIWQLVKRDVAGRYRGSLFGMLWSLLNPLTMLAVYTLAFGVVFKTRWPGAKTESLFEFSILLFAGLIVFSVFSECVTRAPGIVLQNPNFVKKVVFPLEVLPVVLLGSALFHAATSLTVLLAGIALVHGELRWTVLLFPCVLLPVALLSIGLAWIFASVGVFVRDVAQAIGVCTSALMFLSPIFFPLAALPEALRRWAERNPLAMPIEYSRQVLMMGEVPEWRGWLVHTSVSAGVALVGFWWFQRTKRAFADVI